MICLSCGLGTFLSAIELSFVRREAAEGTIMVFIVSAFLGFVACFFLSLVVFLILNRVKMSESMSDCFGAAGGIVTTGLITWLLWTRPEGLDGSARQGGLLGILVAALVLVVTFGLMKRQDARAARP